MFSARTHTKTKPSDICCFDYGFCEFNLRQNKYPCHISVLLYHSQCLSREFTQNEPQNTNYQIFQKARDNTQSATSIKSLSASNFISSLLRSSHQAKKAASRDLLCAFRDLSCFSDTYCSMCWLRICSRWLVWQPLWSNTATILHRDQNETLVL